MLDESLAIPMAVVANMICESVVPNFRKTTGAKNVYRSSAPDNLADVILGSTRHQLLECERFILYDVTLLIDLRSAAEGDDEKRRILTERAPGGQFHEIKSLEELITSSTSENRQWLRLPDSCTLTKPLFVAYVGKNWIDKEEWENASDTSRSELVYQTINSRGLSGLVEAILETKLFISTVLKAITIHLEQRGENGKVNFHCNLGKDRAGVVAMLCESILGVADEDVVEDFCKSRCIQALAEQRYTEIFKGKVDSVQFSDAPPHTMLLALEYLRNKYGSIASYLDSTGFDEIWRKRFIATVAS
jgi:hypothetical protein